MSDDLDRPLAPRVHVTSTEEVPAALAEATLAGLRLALVLVGAAAGMADDARG